MFFKQNIFLDVHAQLNKVAPRIVGFYCNFQHFGPTFSILRPTQKSSTRLNFQHQHSNFSIIQSSRISIFFNRISNRVPYDHPLILSLILCLVCFCHLYFLKKEKMVINNLLNRISLSSLIKQILHVVLSISRSTNSSSKEIVFLVQIDLYIQKNTKPQSHQLE